MKLNCNVEVKNRNVNEIKRRPIKSVVALGKQPNEELFIMLFNSTHKSGLKYAVQNNLEQVFTKFAAEGKTTLRFKEPPHDILIQGDQIELKCFLRTLQAALTKKVPLKELGLSSLSVTTSKKSIPQTKLVITRRSDYPKHGFPRTLESLKINDIARCSLDKGILYLQRLRSLDLSNNIINDIPPDLSLLSLAELNLSKNEFGKCRDWRWIGNNLAKSLRNLNLSNNNMEFVPININQLKSLITLDLSHNKLRSIPHTVATMPALKNLNISSNLLQYLPSSLYVLHFDWIDVSDNQFISTHSTDEKSVTSTMSLFELAASRTVQCKLPQTPGTLPVTVIQFLQKSMICVCGRATFSKRYRCISTLYKKFVKSNTILKSGIFPTVECIFCSVKCFKSFMLKYPNVRL